jgi:hypothetical protein
MIAASNDRRICDVGQSVAFGDKPLKVFKEFMYFCFSFPEATP